VHLVHPVSERSLGDVVGAVGHPEAAPLLHNVHCLLQVILWRPLLILTGNGGILKVSLSESVVNKRQSICKKAVVELSDTIHQHELNFNQAGLAKNVCYICTFFNCLSFRIGQINKVLLDLKTFCITYPPILIFTFSTKL
jgi:hypothetical protein